VIIRATGRTPYHCSDKCRSAAWRDQARGRSGPDLAQRKAIRRAAREAEPSRITPGEQEVIRYAWLSALGYYAWGRPGQRQVCDDLIAEAMAGTWPEPFALAAARGEMPSGEGDAAVFENVLSERMKLCALRSIRARMADRKLREGVLA
jgi:hypothetical protein